MQWKFTPEIVDQIIYAMENQDTTFCMDFATGELAAIEQSDRDAESERYYDLPGWRSHEGFQLMERFVTNLRDPIHRDGLREALSTGKGVFRQFKNALKGRPELEKLWYGFKEREMKRVVYEWYNQICEIRGLAGMEPPDIEIEELILSDFALFTGVGDHREALDTLDREVFASATPERDTGEEIYRRSRAGLPSPLDSIVIRAETPGGDFAGFVWGVGVDDGRSDPTEVRLIQLAVTTDYRGLGLGRALLGEFVKTAERTGAERTVIDLIGPQMAFAPFLQAEGFAVSSQHMELDLNRWSEERE